MNYLFRYGHSWFMFITIILIFNNTRVPIYLNTKQCSFQGMKYFWFFYRINFFWKNYFRQFYCYQCRWSKILCIHLYKRYVVALNIVSVLNSGKILDNVRYKMNMSKDIMIYSMKLFLYFYIYTFSFNPYKFVKESLELKKMAQNSI